ncbi:MAG: hypothetical protein JO167_12120 [Alphaproteobacteria bacterium]|nr:hypothetical protein [Alphaproteobacteria bacterium]MBV9904274.1 hypothetical protein [Alphaproteobacteria bacterium]
MNTSTAQVIISTAQSTSGRISSLPNAPPAREKPRAAELGGTSADDDDATTHHAELLLLRAKEHG